MATGRDAAVASCWAVYVVLHLGSDLAPSAGRDAAVCALLELTAPAWGGDTSAQHFLTSTLGLPPAWLAAAQAVWAGYLGDHAARLDHLLDAGAADAAHALFCAHVAPGLFLEATGSSVARLVRLAGRLAALQTSIGPSWAAGGGLYQAWCRLFVLQPEGGAVAPTAGANWRRDVVAEAVQAGGSGDAAAAVMEAASLLAQQLVAAGATSAGSGGGASAAPARRAVVARMSADVGQVLARLGRRAQAAALAGGGGSGALAAAAAASAAVLQQGCASLGAHQPVVLSGLAAELAVL